MRRLCTNLAAAAACAVGAALWAGPAAAQVATTTVVFPRGASSTVISGTSIGSQTRDYVVRARAGQTLTVDLSGSPIVFFNVLPPGSNDEAIFIGSNEGRSFAGTLSVSGPYKIRVYQMRASARRGERGNYRLAVAVNGDGSGADAGQGTAAGGGWGGGSGDGGGGRNGLRGLAGMDSVRAMDVMTGRGFQDVDSFTTGNTQYGIFYNRATGVCAQLTMADNSVVAATRLSRHPKCR